MWQLCSTLRQPVAKVVGQAVESCEVLQQGQIFMISFMLVGLRLLGLVSLVFRQELFQMHQAVLPVDRVSGYHDTPDSLLDLFSISP